MKQAIAYIRISTKDQSNFSIPGQRQLIQDYCARRDISLLAEFIDNGQSAKNFDRADWKNLEAFVRSNYKNIDHLIVIKFDRFSRNVAEGLNMIEKLEKKYGITILSVFEEIAINPESPFFFKMRADMLVQAEFELRVIRDRTKFGVAQAKKEGRWINRAPYGYVNKRDEKDKPIIVIDHEPNEKGYSKADIVKEIFSLWITGNTLKNIERRALEMGFKNRNHSVISNILKNPAYCGMVANGEDLFKALHEPLIGMATFNKAQELFPKNSQVKVVMNDEVPLRGVLKCSCGRYLTAGKSKGKTKYYWYYKCTAHLEFNYSAETIHTKLEQILTGLSITSDDLERIKKRTQDKIKAGLKRSNPEKLGKKIKDLEEKINSLEAKFINNQINHATYMKWNGGYNAEINQLKTQLKQAEVGSRNVWADYKDVEHVLTNLYVCYKELPLIKKQRMINAVFNHSLKYQLNSFFIDEVMPEFAEKAASLKQKGLLKTNKPFLISGQNPISTPSKSVFELLDLFKETLPVEIHSFANRNFITFTI